MQRLLHTLPARAFVSALLPATLLASACGDGIAERTEGALQVSASGNSDAKFVTFELTPPGFHKDAEPNIEIKNGGKGDLTITKLQLETDSTGYITVRGTLPEAPYTITPDQELKVSLRLSIPTPAESDVPLDCPDPPAGYPADLDPERYCGRIVITSNARENNTDVVYFLVDQSSGRIKVEPDVISFDTPRVGQTQRAELKISNTGSGALNLKNITKTQFTEGTSGDFSIEGFAFPQRLEANEELVYTVVYTPSVESAVEGRLEIESDDPSASKKLITVRTGATNSARIAVDPTALVFSDAAPGSPETQEITVTNEGTGAGLTINDLQIVPTEAQAAYTVLADLDNDGTFEPWTRGSTLVITRQNSRVFQIQYEPTAAGVSISGSLRIRSNATNVSNGEVTVSLQGGEGGPIGSISPSTLVFNVAPGGAETRVVSVANDGVANLELSGVELQNIDAEEFSFSPDPAGLSVAPGAIQAIEVTYSRSGDDIGPDVGSFALLTNDALAPELVVNVRNNHTENGIAPVASITQTPDGAVTAGTEITLDGSASDAGASNVAYHLWTLAGAPAGSSARLDANDQAVITFTPDVAGTYRVVLTVGNDSSPPLEGTATRQITVTP